MIGNYPQLYIIHAPLGDAAVPCVYALMSGKTQENYTELFEAVISKCETMGCSPDPVTVMTDFDQAVIQAVRNTFGGHVSHKGCFFHLTQSTWRKIQELERVDLYKTDDAVKQFCGMLDGLAFLPMDDVTEGMAFLKDNTPDRLEGLVEYFDRVYVTGAFRRIQPPAGPDAVVQPVRFRRVPPLFPPPLWNVHLATLNNEPRTNISCEAWNLSFQKLIGYHHLSIWTIITNFRKDHALVETALFNNANGQPPQKRVKKATKNLQERLQNLCEDTAGRKRLAEFMRAIGNCVRFKQ